MNPELNNLSNSKVNDDHKIIQEILNGNKELYSLLVDKYMEKIRNLIFNITNNIFIVDDLTQEVFVKAYESLPQFQFRSSFYTWIYRITLNKCKDHIRKKKLKYYFPILSISKLSNDIEDNNNIFNKIDDNLLVQEALNKLKYDFKEILILKEIENLTYQEISEVLNCEIGTVKSKLARARTSFARIVNQLFKDKNEKK